VSDLAIYDMDRTAVDVDKPADHALVEAILEGKA
jgi:hypothetical protein